MLQCDSLEAMGLLQEFDFGVWALKQVNLLGHDLIICVRWGAWGVISLTCGGDVITVLCTMQSPKHPSSHHYIISSQ